MPYDSMLPEPRRTTTPLEKLHAKAKLKVAENELAYQLAVAKIQHIPQYLWDEPKTKRAADFVVWNSIPTDSAILVEVDGGLFVNGGHTRGAARERDYERDAEAMLLGFRVLRVSPRHVRNGKAIAWITELLK